MFEGRRATRLTGFFDFYFAGVDTLLFDIAVCLNDWCIDLDTGRLDEDRASAFVAAYAGVRALSGDRVAPAAGDDARRRPALLAVAAVGSAPAARRGDAASRTTRTHFERVLRERVARPWHHVR